MLGYRIEQGAQPLLHYVLALLWEADKQMRYLLYRDKYSQVSCVKNHGERFLIQSERVSESH